MNTIQIHNKKMKTHFFKNPSYWDRYIHEYSDVKRTSFNLKHIHFFNEIPYTRWPFYIAFSLFLFVYIMLLSLKKFDWVLGFNFIGYSIPVVALYFFHYFVEQWFDDMWIESSIFGKYNRKIRACLTYGFVLFVVSEIFFFSGFFWSYFDRFFHPSSFLGEISLPYGLQSLFKSTKSFAATMLLVSSGTLLNYGVYLLRIGSWIYSYILFFISCLLGFCFLLIQYYEYNYVLMFNITNTVYSSLFFMLTGFHGLHVIVGLLMLLNSLNRLYHREFISKERHLLLMLSIFYWHFVDIIWIFLYITVYVWNFNQTYYISSL